MKTALIVLLVLIFIVIFSSKISTYAPPREATTVLPFVEPSNNYPVADSQSNVFMDAEGWINQREHPLAPFIQSNLYATGDFGDFVGLESSSGAAPMYVISSEDQQRTSGPGFSIKMCPRSVVRLVNNNVTLDPGTHNINRDSYEMDVFPPLRVVATGPSARQEMNYPGTELCPVPIKLVLDKDKSYDTLVLSTSTLNQGNLVPESLDLDQRRSYVLQNEYIPNITSRAIPFIGEEQQASSTSQ